MTRTNRIFTSKQKHNVLPMKKKLKILWNLDKIKTVTLVALWMMFYVSVLLFVFNFLLSE